MVSISKSLALLSLLLAAVEENMTGLTGFNYLNIQPTTVNKPNDGNTIDKSTITMFVKIWSETDTAQKLSQLLDFHRFLVASLFFCSVWLTCDNFKQLCLIIMSLDTMQGCM